MAKKKKMSQSARRKLSRMAKRRPRYKTGPKKGKFKPMGRSSSSSGKKRSSSSGKKRSSSSGKKRSTPRKSSADQRRRAAARRAAKGRKRNSKGQFMSTERSSSKPRRRRDTGSGAPFPLDLAMLNPKSMESVKAVAKTGAGVATGIMAGVGVRHLAKLPTPGVTTDTTKDVMADVVQSVTPVVLGFALGKAGWQQVGSGMMAAGAGIGFLAVVRRIANAVIPEDAERRVYPGINRIDLGMVGDGTGVVFLRDARGRVYMESPDKRLFRLNGLNDSGKEPLVRVMLEDGGVARFGYVGNIKLPNGKRYRVLRDPRSDELSMLPYLPYEQRRKDVRAGRAERGKPRLTGTSGIVPRTSQFQKRPQRRLDGIVPARSQFDGGGQHIGRDRNMSGIVPARSQFQAARRRGNIPGTEF